MPLSKEQLRFINTVATVGTPKLASDQLGVEYSIYNEWQSDREFRDEVSKAKQFFKEGINETLGVLAKRELLKIMMNGIVELTTTYKTIINNEGEVVGEERNVKRVYKGVPSWAIKECLNLIPEIHTLIEAMNAHNSLPPDSLEAVKYATAEYEKQLRSAISGDKENNSIPPDDMIAALQRTLVGG